MSISLFGIFLISTALYLILSKAIVPSIKKSNRPQTKLGQAISNTTKKNLALIIVAHWRTNAGSKQKTTTLF